MAWVPFHQELREGDKRGLPRAVRFIFLELSLMARAGRGVVKLPRGMSDVDALHDVLGGSRAEVEAALAMLTEVPEDDEDPEPMIRIEGPSTARRVVVTSWQAWCGSKETPDAVTARTKRHREKVRANRSGNDVGTTRERYGNDTGTVVERSGNESGTVGNDDREEKRRERGEKNSSSWSTRAREDHPEMTGPGPEPVESSPPEHAAEASDAPNHVDDTENHSLATSRANNGQSDAVPLPAVAPVAGPDFLTKASLLADAGNGYGVDMLDWAAQGKAFRPKQRETIDRLYAEHLEGQANAARARAAKAELATGPSTSRSGAPANQRDEQAMALWCDLWSKQHRENYPITERDFNAMRKLVARAETRARELGGDTRVSDVLNHIFAKYLRISDNKLVSERYPLALLESRLPAIGEYRPQKATSPKHPPPRLPARGTKPPPDMAAFANSFGRVADTSSRPGGNQ